MRLILLIILALLSISCGTYHASSYYNEIENILAITKSGDTIQVPIKQFDRYKYDNYVRFQWNDNWYWNNYYLNQYYWSNTYYPRYNRFRPIYYGGNNNSTPRYNPPTKYPTQTPRVRVNVPRGSNAGPRPNTPSRVRTTPNVVSPAPRSTPGKGCAKC
jgi:hypothetical protein|tara:strand:- start:27 stop:503 length:477 start_codon:yes stop_codon:yes gene_type:complete